MEIAVIGNEEFVLGFRLAGLRRVFIAEPGNYHEKIMEAFADPEIDILAVNAKDLQGLSTNIKNKIINSIHPVVVSVGDSVTDLREKIKRAIGVDLYKEDE
ncbi:MAG: V-type ATP synthase subunit F [archaeon]|nr:V-type ATP synthase subunit F [archaeon]